MRDFLITLVPVCFAMAIIGWIWLIVIGFKNKGVGTGLLFLLIGFFAMVYGYKNWRDPDNKVKSNTPFFMMTGGLTMMLLLTILSSFLK